MRDAHYWINKLDLKPHPEGGYFKEIYRSDEVIFEKALPMRFSGDRVFSTSIYFLLNKNDFSAFHRIKQDEVWHFYEGSSLTIHIIDQTGIYSAIQIGRNIENNELFQFVVKRGCWFAASVNNIEEYSLVGCTVPLDLTLLILKWLIAKDWPACIPNTIILLEILHANAPLFSLRVKHRHANFRIYHH